MGIRRHRCPADRILHLVYPVSCCPMPNPSPLLPRTQFTFAYPLRIRWAEVDAQGIVFNGHYMTYFDVGITEYWRAAGLVYPRDFTTADTDLFLRKATITYHAPAYFDDLIDICVCCTRIGHTSMTYTLAIYRQETHLTEGELIYVCANPKTRTAQPIPSLIRERLCQFEPCLNP